ncbi:MAG: hypothetical protein ACRECH_10750 [Nitrososphaerales archaeon]
MYKREQVIGKNYRGVLAFALVARYPCVLMSGSPLEIGALGRFAGSAYYAHSKRS